MIMAEGSEENKSEFIFQKVITDSVENTDENNSESPSHLHIELNSATCSKTTPESHNKSASLGSNNDTPRREENPFSFKHFLKREQSSSSAIPSPILINESQPPYHNTGARPKVFPSPLHTHTPLTLSLDGHQHLRKSKHITLDPRFTDYNQQDDSTDTSCTEDSSRVSVEIPSSKQSNSMTNLFQRPFSDRDSSYQPPASPTAGSVFENSSFRHNPPRIGSSEFSSALPDFVQDHIILEQWYSGLNSPPSSSNLNVDFDKLPDFAVSDKDNGRCRLLDLGRAQSEILPSHKDLPCDLTSTQGSLNRKIRSSNSKSVPLDLPNCNMPFDLPNRNSPNQLNTSPLDLPNGLYLDLTGNMGQIIEDRLSHPMFERRDMPFPLDLPLHVNDGNHDNVNLISNEVPKSLPDFLSDGPIHSDRLADIAQGSPENQGLDNLNDANDAVSRLSLENERLRRELEISRRQSNEHTQRIMQLQSQLSVARQTEGQYTTRLASAMATVENNIAQSNKRATEAESTVSRLKKQIKQLTIEIEELKQEIRSLQGGATSNWSHNTHNTHRVSHELRQAASSAEQYLRHLLTGVDNLRSLAATIENIPLGVTQEQDDFLTQTDDGAGPAL